MSARPAAVRFWSRVDKAADGECWTWTGGRTAAGYGYFDRDGRRTGAHRHSFEVHHGPIPDGLNVLHRCDNRPCVNPAHLFLGTQADNVRDMYAKGREPISVHDGTQTGRMRRALARRPDLRARGERVGSAKLTATQVADIRARLADGSSQSAIAREYGVVHQLVNAIALRRVWRHIA